MHFTQEQVVGHTKAPPCMHRARTVCSTSSEKPISCGQIRAMNEIHCTVKLVSHSALVYTVPHKSERTTCARY